jgi:hypothetical protein
MNIGEEIVSAYLEYIKHCEFTQKNLNTPDVQGEIDVVGIDLEGKTIYLCEVAIHLTIGLQYVKNNKPNNIEKLVEKFSKDIEYAKKYFQDYKIHVMLWSPVVKETPNAKHNQMDDVRLIKSKIMEKYGIDVELIINEKFLLCLEDLRNYARMETKDIKSPVIRLMQVEEYLKKHIKKSSAVLPNI